MSSPIFGVLQRVGKAFMLPIALLPVAGLLLGIGASFTNETMLTSYGLMGVMGPGTLLFNLLSIMKNAGDIVFANLPILFAMGVAAGMANSEKEVATLSGAVAYFVMHATINAMLGINGKLAADALHAGSLVSTVGIISLQMGVFGGILVGFGVAALHNRYHKIEFPQVFAFFGGSRFVPIISSLVYVVVGIVMYYIWPMVQNGIYTIGSLVNETGYFGTFLYGLTERALIPFGLHHVFYMPFWQTGLGGSMIINGQLVEGAQKIFFAQLADPTVLKFNAEATRYMAGKFPFMIFGLPGAALAMYVTAKPEKKKLVGGLLLSAALTAIITGITEPIEFTFLFVAPMMYAIHCVLAGLSFMLMYIFRVGVGMTFSGGFIDLLLFGILQGEAKTNWLYIVLVGVFYFPIYFFLFRFLILKYNFKTPGREDEDAGVKLYTRSDYDAKNDKGKSNEDKKETAEPTKEDDVSSKIEIGLGGAGNIVSVDACITRLRVNVKDGSLVNKDILKSTGAVGVMQNGDAVQVIYGPKVSVIKSRFDEYLANQEKERS
ncbi:MAG: PTS transporter subunit EIIC [Synergistaceae bacterium]|nr:PTS transporter subunit EIIC [Synergistaceae bacterium]MBP9626333.1 PTS transporter subunit EIIC [Synergistaceae bacterium]MBP9958003.1 PTS transporter subunit EIIC [Synergistaceae bacterium]